MWGQVMLGKHFIACPAFLAAFFRGPLAVMCDCDRKIFTRDSRAYYELNSGEKNLRNYVHTQIYT